jgi:hypothetical protein
LRHLPCRRFREPIKEESMHHFAASNILLACTVLATGASASDRCAGAAAALPAGAVFEAGSLKAGAAPVMPRGPMLRDYPNHPGWPVAIQGGGSPPVCADLDPQVPGLEIALGSLTTGPNLYVFHQDGTLMSGYPVDVGTFVAGSPSVADINGDGELEIVVGDFGTNQVWALHAGGTPLPGWPIPVGANVRSTAALADLDPSVPGLEVIIGVQDGTVEAWHVDGTPVAGWPVMAGNFVERCSPAVGDVNGDGFLEVFVGSWYDYNTGSTGGVYGFDHTGAALPGWPKLTSTHTSVIASPVLADIDGDGVKEIVAGTYEVNAKMYVWRGDGTDVAGWPYTIPRGASSSSLLSSSPAVGDIDGDGELEIVDGSCGQCGTVYAWKRDGTVAPGWPVTVNCVVDGSSPVLGDVDGDGATEIVIGSGSGFTPYGCTAGEISKMYVFRHDGTLEPGWPLDLGTAAPPNPALADVDGDGLVEIAVSYSQAVYLWDAPGTWSAPRILWPYYHLGIDHTGDLGPVDPASVEGAAAPLPSLQVRPNPRIGPGLVSFSASGPVEVFDSGGRLLRILRQKSWDCRDARGLAVPSGVYLLRRSRERQATSLTVIR